jgi:endonuclease/exonuclease/phosphatase family metal-dependent hydrolase
MRLRAATYNARSFRGGVDRAAALFEEAGPAPGGPPDVLMLQECGRRRVTRAFAEALGMGLVSSHRPFRRVRNAILYGPSWRPVSTAIVDLPRDRGAMPRGFVAVRLRRDGVTLTVASAHLGLGGAERRRHARLLADELVAGGAAVVLGADLNEGPDGPAARWISGRLFDAFALAGHGPGETFPARSPSARIDYVLVGEGVRVVAARVLAGAAAARASDHLPLVADLEVEVPSALHVR